MEAKEFTEKVVQINRVSKKTKGGNRIGFSVLVVIGDKKGRVGVGLGKAPEPKNAILKAVRYAKKHLINVPMIAGTITHDIYVKLGAAKVLLRKAPEGTGVIAGGAVRAVVEAAGVKNIVSKTLGTSNQASNVYATLEALKRLKPVSQIPQNLRPENLKEEKESTNRRIDELTNKDTETKKEKIEVEKPDEKKEEKKEVKVETKKPVGVEVVAGKRGRKPVLPSGKPKAEK